MMNPNDFDDPLTFPLVSARGSHVVLSEIYQQCCHDTWYTHLFPLQDKLTFHPAPPSGQIKKTKYQN